MAPTPRTFDVRPQGDPRDAEYPIRALLTTVPERRPKFYMAGIPRLDQGREGACVGFGWTAELQASPKRVALPDGDAYARWLYRQAKLVDPWPGEDYTGTSVGAGAKVLQKAGYIAGYRWCRNVDDLIDALMDDGFGGPVVIGVPWFTSMYGTRPSGLVEVSGKEVGHHCLLVTGYHPSMRLTGEPGAKRFEVLRWRNSWGAEYGKRGDAYVERSAFEHLWAEGGSGCVPIGRRTRALGVVA